MHEERDDDGFRLDPKEFAARQAELAGSEAAAIGGRAGDENLDPAQRPVKEAGGGESEGFEMAEEDLIRNASHGDDVSDSVVFRDAGAAESESDRQTGEFAEGDSVGQPRDINSDQS